MRRPSLVIFVALVALAACGGGGGTTDAPPPPIDAPPPTIDAPPDAGPPGPTTEHFDIPVYPDNDLDLLFVVDNSGSMLEEQQSLTRNFPQFIDALANLPNGLPNLHLGVISSDMGTLGVPTGDPACSDSDNGILVKGDPDLPNQCPQVNGLYISDVLGPTGRVVNYSGTLEDAFSCTAAVGKNGCGFEQHLASMRAALDGNPPNATFLRPNANLALVFIADEDDCSAEDPAFFGPESPTLGPIDSFRCFEKAIACNEGSDVALRDVGIKTGCHVDDTQDYLRDVGDYVAFVKGLKGDSHQIVVAGIIGPNEPVEVGRRTPTGSTVPRPDLIPSCSYTDITGFTNTADPGIRLKTFLEAFENHNTFTTICDDDYSDALVQIGELVGNLVGDTCVENALVDADADPSNGLQPDCEFSYVAFPDEPEEMVTPLPACDAGMTNQPCWHLVEDLTNCADTPTQLAVVVERTVEPPLATRIIGSCQIE